MYDISTYMKWYWTFLEKACHFTRVEKGGQPPEFYRGLYKYVPAGSNGTCYCLRYIVGNPYPTVDEKISFAFLEGWYRAYQASIKVEGVA